MAKVSNENNLKAEEDGQDKGFNQWRQPKPPESPKSPEELISNSPEDSVQNKSLCSVKDLSRLSRKRRTLFSATGARICSRKRGDDKTFVSKEDTKQRTIKKGRFTVWPYYYTFCKFTIA